MQQINATIFLRSILYTNFFNNYFIIKTGKTIKLIHNFDVSKEINEGLLYKWCKTINIDNFPVIESHFQRF